VLHFIIFLIIFIFVFSPLFLGVPFLPTHKKQALKMIELGDIKPGIKVVDLGSGAGRLLFLSAKNGATCVGYELNPFLVLWTRLMIFLRGENGKIQVEYKSIYNADIKDADVVFMFLYPPHMKKIVDKLSEVKKGAKIISYTFPIPGWAPTLHEQGIFVYEK